MVTLKHLKDKILRDGLAPKPCPAVVTVAGVTRAPARVHPLTPVTKSPASPLASCLPLGARSPMLSFCAVPLCLGAHVFGLGELLLAAGALCAGQLHHPNAAPLLLQLLPVSLLLALDPMVGFVGVRLVLPLPGRPSRCPSCCSSHRRSPHAPRGW